MSKKLVPVEIIGATVIAVNDIQLQFLATDTLIYLISLSDQPEFKKFPLEEGSVVWLYFIPVNRKVSGIIPFDSTPIEQLPTPIPVEIEVNTKAARY